MSDKTRNGADNQPDKMTALAVTSERQLWDRMPNESDSAWKAFLYYRGLPLGERTYAAVQHALYPQVRYPPMMRYITIWTKQFTWKSRAIAWDYHLDRIQQHEFEEETKRMARRHAQLAMNMQDVGSARIQEFATREELKETMTSRDAVTMVDTGVRIEREARGETKEKGDGSTIIFNIGMKEVPKWAPKNLPTDVKEVTAEVIPEEKS